MDRCSVRTQWLLLSGLCWLLASCGGPSSGTTDLDTSHGRLNLSITDAPVDFAKYVYVQFSGIEVKGKQNILLYFCEDPADATTRIVNTSPCAKSKPMMIDLLEKRSGAVAALLRDYPLDAGQYESLRLIVDAMTGVDDSYLVLKDNIVTPAPKYELAIPAEETGLKLNYGFDVEAGGRVDLTIDFDLRKSVREESPGVYTLRPSLRIVDNQNAGAIVGAVHPALILSPCSPAVYVYAGLDRTPGDLGSTNEPITTAMVITTLFANNTFSYTYRAAFLEANNYTVAYTCDAANDNPATDENLSFRNTGNVIVPAQTQPFYDFR